MEVVGSGGEVVWGVVTCTMLLKIIEMECCEMHTKIAHRVTAYNLSNSYTELSIRRWPKMSNRNEGMYSRIDMCLMKS